MSVHDEKQRCIFILANVLVGENRAGTDVSED